MTTPFQGTGFALSADGLSAVASDLGVHAPEIWALLAVETKGCGYLPDRRTEILYERHVFDRLTGGRFDDGDISDRLPGGYGPTGAHQYERLAAAMEQGQGADVRTAALKAHPGVWAKSWVRISPQQDFKMLRRWSQPCRSPKTHSLLPWLVFSLSLSCRRRCRPTTGRRFARGYNGPNFVINRYDVRLNAEFQKFSGGVLQTCTSAPRSCTLRTWDSILGQSMGLPAGTLYLP
jgi:hypothetical protein